MESLVVLIWFTHHPMILQVHHLQNVIIPKSSELVSKADVLLTVSSCTGLDGEQSLKFYSWGKGVGRELSQSLHEIFQVTEISIYTSKFEML
jgi:hypothetical protein